MSRRRFLRTFAGGGVLLTAGCVESLRFGTEQVDPSAVFAGHRFEGTDLVVEFRDGTDVERIALVNSSTDETYDVVEHPRGAARFPVVFPGQLKTYVAQSLHVRVETPDGSVRRWIPETVHAYVDGVEVLGDGRARFDVMNQGEAPLLVRFVGVHGDVPNPTVDPQAESFDRSSFELGPGVVGVGSNRPLSPTRTDLVVPAGETAPFETTYAPFAFPNGADSADCDGSERIAEITVVHASGGSAAYTFSYRLDGEPTPVEGHDATVCGRGR